MLQRHQHVLIEQDPMTGRYNIYAVAPLKLNATPQEAQYAMNLAMSLGGLGAGTVGMPLMQFPMQTPIGLPMLPAAGGAQPGFGDGASAPISFGNVAQLALPGGAHDQRIRAILFRRKGAQEGVKDPRYEFKKKEVEDIVKRTFAGVKDIKVTKRTTIDRENGEEADKLIDEYFWLKLRPDSKFDLPELSPGIKSAVHDTIVELRDPEGEFTGIKLILANPREKVVKEKGYERVDKLARALAAQGHRVFTVAGDKREGLKFKQLGVTQTPITGFGSSME